MKSGSLRLRVTLSVTVALAVVLIALVVVVDALFGRQTVQDQNNLIRDRLQLAKQLETRRLQPEQLYARLAVGGFIFVRVQTPSGLDYGSKPYTVSCAGPPT